MTNQASSKKHKSSLQLLTSAALVLPGLLQAPAYADDEEVDFQYSHYQEGRHPVYANLNFYNGGPFLSGKVPNYLNPIEVEGLHGGARMKLSDRLKFSFNYTQDTWSGATPLASAPVVVSAAAAVQNPVSKAITGASPLLRQTSSKFFYIDKRGNIILPNSHYDIQTGITTVSPGRIHNQLTDVLVGASPETRQQGDFKLNYDWDNAAASIGGGESVENDYDSRFGNLGLRLDFNQKRTAINAGLSYTNSDTHATLDPFVCGYMGTGPYTLLSENATQIAYSPLTEGTLHNVVTVSGDSHVPTSNIFTLTGNRQDVAFNLGLSQVLTQSAVLDLGASFTHSSGYLSNPYKGVYVFNADPGQGTNQPLLYHGQGQWEARPHERNQINGSLGFHYYLETLKAGLHGQYTVAHDDWGINAHTLDGNWVQPLDQGWTLTPHLRYYSQSAANFYAPYFTTVQVANALEPGNNIFTKPLPNYYSSDQRLSGYGAISGGVTVAKQFAKGISLETGFEYYSHQGGLKLGGGGEQAFADYDYWSVNAALKLNLGALQMGGGHDRHHASSSHRLAAMAPAGIMFNHALDEAGDMMVGYRYMRTQQGGDMLSGSSVVDTQSAIANGCGTGPDCMMLPAGMSMNMHMLELMLAAGDRLTLMLMPQWSDMDMNMDMMPMHMTMPGMGVAMPPSTQQSGGIGDTGLYALVKLLQQPGQQLTLSLGGSAPTGDTNVQHRINSASFTSSPLDYSMQLGSGTWDLKPSLTYSGTLNDFAWGAQATGTKRMQSKNDSGYSLGDIFQGSIWGGYRWNRWLSNTIRGVYTWQDKIQGAFNPIVYPDGSSKSYTQANTAVYGISAHNMPNNYTSNYGGQYVDLGLGINVTVPGGVFAGHSLKLEWLQPLYTQVNGYQLNRDYALTASWGMDF